MHSCMCAGRVASNLLISPPFEGASGKDHALGQTLKEKPVSLEIKKSATNQAIPVMKCPDDTPLAYVIPSTLTVVT